VALDPKRTVAELRDLQELTGDDNGAQRLAWTDTWERAREWLRGKVAETGAEETLDAAGNQWFTLRGVEPDRAVLIGGHIDSVPNGGWLDGSLNVLGGVEVLRRIAADGSPPVTVRLVNWADEEGARFGRSLFGSSAAAGSMADQDELRARKDADGITLPDALRGHGVDLDSALDARSELEGAAAYLELHIEQGPVLAADGLDIGVVTSIVGLRGYRVRIRGEANHAGTTPMRLRRDALVAAARIALELREFARARESVTANVGKLAVAPGGANVVPGFADFTIDVRATTEEGVRELESVVEATVTRIAGEEGVDAELEQTFALEPLELDGRLVGTVERAAISEGATFTRMPSGAGHDAMVVGRHVPAAMIFVPSRGGISHSPEEYTHPSQLELGMRVLAATLRQSLRSE
jgi:N-carbamoyl-L-amino-acid hydrolase